MCFTKYYRNFILCGEVENYCLLCDEIFHKLDDIEKHIRWEKHRKVLKSQICLPKFKNDGIFKVENYYYCQFCNHIAHNIASVKKHIATDKHTVNKTAPEVTSNRIQATYSAGTVIIKKLKIDSLQWNGIQNNLCLLCNEKVGNELKHIRTSAHIIRLIQTEIKLEGEGEYYRKVNATTFQCFTCMTTFLTEDFDKHWEQHKNPTISKDINGNSEQPIKIYDQAEFNKLFDREYDVAKLENIQDDFFEIDIKNKELTCKQCWLAVQNTKNDLANHMIKKHKNYYFHKSNIIEKIEKDTKKEYIYIYERDAGKERHDLAVYGKVNNIKLNAGGSKGYCILCDRFLSAHMNIFKQHVEGSIHTGHQEIKGLIKSKKHKRASNRLEIFFRHLLRLVYFPDMDAVSVNLKFCIDSDSFLLVKRIEHGKHFKLMKCFVCDEVFNWSKDESHCSTQIHKDHVMAAKVVIEEYNYFIREIKPKLYHCSLCNVTCPFWDTLEKHIGGFSHKTKVMEKDLKTVMNHHHEKHGCFPESKDIQLSNNSDVLYANILKVLHGNKLNNIRIFTIDLEKLQNSNSRGVVILS